jgi:CheY-like chemotaxis protein
MSVQPDWGALRLLIVGGKTHTAQTLRTVMGIVGIRDVTIASDSGAALELLRNQKYAAVFCDENTAPIKQMPFSRAARHAAGVLNPMIPIFLVSSTPRRRLIEAERDRGISDVIARPVSAATIIRKLRLALERPRSFIKAGEYFGPDRRGETRPPFGGNDRRDRAARKVKVNAKVARDLAADDPGATYI